MEIKQLLLMAAMASIAVLGNSCSEVGNDSPVQANKTPVQTQSLEKHDSHNHGNQGQEKTSNPTGHSHDKHDHKPLEVSADQPIPTVDLIVHKDAVIGWNLEVQVSNFQFAPENVNQESKTNEGHAHLYINGEKIARLYSSWHHLDSLESGENEVKVTLNANGHEDLFYQGNEIADTELIQVPVRE